MEKVTFVGVGPGAPDLLTIRGKNIIAGADVVIYAGSLVNPEILSYCKKDAEIYNSAKMTLKEVVDVMENAVKAGKRVARVHTGDPSIYGAEQEQMRELDRLGIPYEVVPGVSSFLAAAASLKREYTLPGVSQSVILTRMEGRTSVPDAESIESLAAHQTSMVIFLSVGEMEVLCERLISGGYPKDTPAAVVYKASWEDEKQVRGTLSDIADRVSQAGIKKTALVLIGRFLDDEFENSRLYDETFSHGYRKAKAETVTGANIIPDNIDKKVRTVADQDIDKSAGKSTDPDKDACTSAKRKSAKRVMIQGTMSGAGKSFVTAGLCRIFRQDGYSAAPFKSQNMALNSCVTREGLEIGRAQAMQAEAAGIEPAASMNPILLKPTGDEESQVIVRGEVAGNMSAAEYYLKKADLIPLIRDSFNELAGKYDIVVIEGAGSPAEINLKENDIVNMGMAAIADAPVILVADIDRGGVFAQIVGTVELMDAEERARIKGIIINKFRGDVELLRPGIEPIEKRLGIPVLGVIPMERIDLDEEDSLAPRLENVRPATSGKAATRDKTARPDTTGLPDKNAPLNRTESPDKAASPYKTASSAGNRKLNIAVIRLPHISNFTDFSVLERWEGVSLTYVLNRAGLKDADIIILPGTKNTMADLAWLREAGLADAIIQMKENSGVPVFGICGGYQMLGEYLSDPEGAEGSRGAAVNGLGLLPVTTTFSAEKTRSQSEGVITDKAAELLAPGLSKREVKGYEIHMGQTHLTDTAGENAMAQKNFAACVPLIVMDDGRYDGFASSDGLCFGTYMHGLFDNVEWTQGLLGTIAAGKGISLPQQCEAVKDYRERQFNRLAGLVRRSVDIDAIYRIMDESDEG